MKNIQYGARGEYGRRSALLFADSEQRRASIQTIADMCNYDLQVSGLDEAAKPIASVFDVLIADLSSILDRQDDTLPQIARYLQTHRGRALIWTNMDIIEEAYAILPHEKCIFLVDASDIDAIPYLTGALKWSKMDQLQDKSRDSEFGDLHKISDELASFALTLARIAEKDEGKSYGVSDKTLSFQPASNSTFTPLGSTSKADTSSKYCLPVTANVIREIIRIRRMRDSHFAAELFADPAWDILLDLYAARLEQKSVSVSSLCIAAAVPPTTALRWITSMTETGMLLRRMDPVDARRVFIELAEETISKLDSFFIASKNSATSAI